MALQTLNLLNHSQTPTAKHASNHTRLIVLDHKRSVDLMMLKSAEAIVNVAERIPRDFLTRPTKRPNIAAIKAKEFTKFSSTPINFPAVQKRVK